MTDIIHMDGFELKKDDKVFDLFYGWGRVSNFTNSYVIVRFNNKNKRNYIPICYNINFIYNWISEEDETFYRTLFWDIPKICTPPIKPNN